MIFRKMSPRTHHNYLYQNQCSLRSSERILTLVFQWYKAANFRGIVGDCQLAAPTDFIRGISAGKLDSFRLDFVSASDERGSVINDYL